MVQRRRRRRRQLTGASNIIYQALCAAGLSEQARRVMIFQHWNDAVGPDIAARTEPQMFRGGTLIVRAASPTWQNELMFLRASIIARINDMLERPLVKELKVVSGVIAPVEGDRKPDPVRQITPRPEDLEAAEALVGETIDDPDIRDAFARLIATDHRARATPSDS